MMAALCQISDCVICFGGSGDLGKGSNGAQVQTSREKIKFAGRLYRFSQANIQCYSIPSKAIFTFTISFRAMEIILRHPVYRGEPNRVVEIYCSVNMDVMADLPALESLHLQHTDS